MTHHRAKHGSHHRPPPHSDRGLASKIMRNKGSEPAGLIGGSDVERADRMGMRGSRAPIGPPPEPAGPPGGLGMAPGSGGGQLPPEDVP